jgi:hypothetical protein
MKLALTLILFVCHLAGTQVAHFSFAGLDLGLTTKDLRVKYPRSSVVGDTLVHLSDTDAHDHISSIALSGSGAAKRLRIFFERNQQTGRPIYPRCEDVLTVLQKRYGSPTNIVDAAEEQALNRRFEWNAARETLTLMCFRMPRQPLYASELNIASKD